MAYAHVNGVRLFYDLRGRGELPLVMVHGGWLSHRSWSRVVPPLAESFRVLTYDRRGHSASERPPGQKSIREDVADLAALIEHLGLAPAWVAAVSSGGSIALRLASERPDLLRGLIVHEPALFSLLADDPEGARMLEQSRNGIAAVVERIAAGDHAGAAEQFVETVALGPGMWERLSPEYREVFIENAETFLNDTNDPEMLAFDLEWIEGFSKPALLTKGDESPPAFGSILDKVAAVMPRAQVLEFEGAGHVPHRTHPDRFAEVVTAFAHDGTP